MFSQAELVLRAEALSLKADQIGPLLGIDASTATCRSAITNIDRAARALEGWLPWGENTTSKNIVDVFFHIGEFHKVLARLRVDIESDRLPSLEAHNRLVRATAEIEWVIRGAGRSHRGATP
jgi:hypothetical protein